jgi:hypothetical protein
LQTAAAIPLVGLFEEHQFQLIGVQCQPPQKVAFPALVEAFLPKDLLPTRVGIPGI